jgi:hypothetical protein
VTGNGTTNLAKSRRWACGIDELDVRYTTITSLFVFERTPTVVVSAINDITGLLKLLL